MATETPFEGDVGERRKQAVKEKLRFGNLALRHRLGVAGILFLALLPTLLTPIELNQVTPVLFLMMFAVSWDVVSGYTGQLSFGHAFFFAMGGYGAAVLGVQHGAPVPVSILGATLLAAVGGILIGVPALRLQGPYLSLVTLIAPLLLFQMFLLFSEGLPYLAPNGLGGDSGIQGPPAIVDYGNAVVTVDNPMYWALGRYYVSLVALLLVVGVCYAVTRSAAGSVFTAIREDEDAVRSAGLNPAKYKIFAFVLSGAVGGFAAAMFVHTVGSPTVDDLMGAGNGLEVSINVITITIIGGMGTVVGPIVGAVFFALVEVIFTGPLGDVTVPVLGVPASELTELMAFLLAMLVLVYMPRGVLPEGVYRGRRVLARIRGEEPPEPPDDRSATKSVLEKFREEIESITGGENR